MGASTAAGVGGDIAARHPVAYRLASLAMVLVTYAGLAIALTWPLSARLSSGLLGDPGGDTGVYIWNLWVFWHEMAVHGRLPISTDHVFAFTGGADFSLHNYTPLADVVAMPLVAGFGPVIAYNVMVLTALTLAGASVYLLARHVGLNRVESWMSGALFVASPVMSARETAHLSLVLAAPLPLFALALLRVVERPTRVRAVAVGVCVAMAMYADAYYGVYCVLIGVVLMAWRFGGVEWDPARVTSTSRALAVLFGLTATLAIWKLWSGVTSIRLAGVQIGLETLYSPMLVLVTLGLLYVYVTHRPRVRVTDPGRELPLLVTRAALSLGSCLLLLSPILLGLGRRFVQGRLPETTIYWRSSPRGVDVLSYLIPNPASEWLGSQTRPWLMPAVDDAYPEFVAAFSLVALLGIVVALAWRAIPGMWVWFTGCFLALSLGPFIHIAGVNTFVVGPWAVLRYVPIVGMARSPARFAIPAALGLSLLAGFAMQAWGARAGRRRPVLLSVAAVLCAVELLPGSRPLFSAAVPAIYDVIADGPLDARVLELPSGLRDGTSSVGNFSARSQFHQTRHGRRLVGGYLSRVSTWRKGENQRVPMLRVLHALSEGRDVTESDRQSAETSRDWFLAKSCVRYVVIDRGRASPDLRAFAARALRLRHVGADGSHELFVPDDLPECLSPLR